MQGPFPPGYGPGYAAQPATPLVAISICGQCGVVAPLNGNTCEVCRRPLAEVRSSAPAQPVDHCWVALRAAFTCNSCRFLAPLDNLDADGAVECAHCGLRQRFDIELWKQGLEFAHAVGDLAGPAPEGRNPHPVLWIGSENPHRETGTTRTFEHATFDELAVDAAPGHPVCGRCREPVALSVPRPGTVETLCPRCGDRASHTISDTAVALCPALVAAVSEEHRSDRPRAQASATAAGVLALTCPSCGAPLELTETGTVHACRYCRASCIVPHKSVARALRKAPEPAVWWLFFQGASLERKSLTEPAGAPEAQAGEAAKKALRLLNLGKVKAIGEAPGVYEAPERQGRNYLQIGLTLALGGLALAIGFVFLVVLGGCARKTAPLPPTNAESGRPPTSAEPPPFASAEPPLTSATALGTAGPLLYRGVLGGATSADKPPAGPGSGMPYWRPEIGIVLKSALTPFLEFKVEGYYKSCFERVIVEVKAGNEWLLARRELPPQGQAVVDGEPIGYTLCDMVTCQPIQRALRVPLVEIVSVTPARSNAQGWPLLESRPLHGEIRVRYPYFSNEGCTSERVAEHVVVL